DESDPAIARVEKHVPVPEEGLQRAAVPTRPLTRQDGKVLGRFGPADGLRREADPVRLAEPAEMFVELNDEFHVLAHCAVAVTSDVEHRLATEKAEGARDDRQSRNPAPR